MAAKIIHIDSYIGRWGYSKELLRYDLDGTQKDGAVLRVSSLGGDVFHALDMYNQIASHGNVEVVFAGPSASAATFLAMAAKRVSIVDNCFLLVHKVMAGVDNYGLFNEDELDELIRSLKNLRSENREFDKVIAHIYAKRTGRTHEQMIRRMKAGTWMSAAQALEEGFVDRIIEPDQKVNYHTARFVAMVSSLELPPFPREDSLDENAPEGTSLQHQSQENENMNHYPRICATLEIPSLESSGEGTYLNDEQLSMVESTLEDATHALVNFDTALSERDLAREANQEQQERITRLTASVARAEGERDASHSELDTARTEAETSRENERLSREELSALTALLDAIDPSVAEAVTAQDKTSAIRALLARMPGAPPAGIMDKGDPDPRPNGVDWALINSLPHNRALDQNL
jgi:ATP-dependent protease ClpP protease subunit